MIRVTGSRVLVALPPSLPETVTASGIILVRDPDRAKIPTRGLVVQLGAPGGTVEVDEVLAILDEFATRRGVISVNNYQETCAAIQRLAPAPFDVQLGDVVLFSGIAGEELELEGQRYVILHESEILAVVEPHTEVA